MTKSKFLIVTPSLKAGGLERVVSFLANWGANLYSIWILSLGKGGCFYKLNSRVNVISPPDSIKNQNRYFQMASGGIWMRNRVKSISPDVICSFGEKYNSFVLLYLYGLGIPTFVANRASPISSLSGFRGFVNPLIYRLAAGVLLQTKKSFSLLNRKYKFHNVQVLHNPIDLDYPLLQREKVILNVGSIGGSKNQDWLLRYFSSLPKPAKNGWKLNFGGDGPQRKQCESLSKALELGDSVTFYGLISNIKPVYAKAAIFAFTSTSEGFPNALAEAMAAGCACIAYDCVAGPSDIIDDEVNGFLIPVGDEEQYKQKLQSLMEDADLRRRFGEAAREKMKQFEANKIARKFYEFISQPL